MGKRRAVSGTIEQFCNSHDINFWEDRLGDLSEEQIDLLKYGDGGATEFYGYVPWINMLINGPSAVSGRPAFLLRNAGMLEERKCPKCNGTGAKPGTSPETCSKCGGKGQVVYTQLSFFGTVQNVQTCPDCHGTGKIIREKCSGCGGTGYVSNRKKISVSIPAGIDNGQSVRIREIGEPGVSGGPRGDLLVEVVVS